MEKDDLIRPQSPFFKRTRKPSWIVTKALEDQHGVVIETIEINRLEGGDINWWASGYRMASERLGINHKPLRIAGYGTLTQCARLGFTVDWNGDDYGHNFCVIPKERKP